MPNDYSRKFPLGKAFDEIILGKPLGEDYRAIAGESRFGAAQAPRLSQAAGFDIPAQTLGPSRPRLDLDLDIEDEVLGDVEIAPGVQAIGARRGRPQPEASGPALDRKQTKGLIEEVLDMSKGLTEIRLPDGTQLKGISPKDIQPMEAAITQQGAPQPIGEGGGEEGAGGFLSKAGGFLSRVLGSPEFQYLAGQAARAIASPEQYGETAASMLGGVGSQLAQTRAYDEYYERLKEGESIESINEDRTFNIIPPEMKAQALRSVLEERAAETKEDYTRALIGETEARTKGYLTRADKLRSEAIDTATRLKLGEMADNNWMNVGQGHVFNINTGEVVKAYDYQTGGTSVGNLKSTDYKDFRDFVSSTYLPIAKANKRAELIAQFGEGSDKLATIEEFFNDKEGRVDFSKVMLNLSETQRQKFASDLQQYVTGEAMGIPRTATFLQQEAQTIRVPDPDKPGAMMFLRQNEKGEWVEVR